MLTLYNVKIADVIFACREATQLIFAKIICFYNKIRCKTATVQN